ncbi:MAG: type II toxin-antitoxin system PemK/MazF family toxin [Prevotellaceae bacterium]|jgi:mRNA interferase MazF|nr:type II toxin-antitoxin system PemK/MazF family toxin [Prevotellaceae bacterium]
MGRIKQFDIFWIGLDPTAGSEMAKTRPCVVVSPNELNDHLRTVIILPVTSTIKDYPFRVPCSISGKNGEIAVDQIRTVDKARINTSKPLGHLSVVEIATLQDALNIMFCQ